ncbi:hypothetical protein A4X13_0g6688 [Tilletia indica]|uniref:Uncharacterized protein n=1 Tax=Tilletia indica TaxID=43049 RepID=A0A177TE16_9BASI|nr:hypothetical protein A4X13_0g6688 [Tilletia indica]
MPAVRNKKVSAATAHEAAPSGEPVYPYLDALEVFHGTTGDRTNVASTRLRWADTIEPIANIRQKKASLAALKRLSQKEAAMSKAGRRTAGATVKVKDTVSHRDSSDSRLDRIARVK